MKKLVLIAMALGIVACSNPVQQSSVPMDMQAVQEYQQRVSNARTNQQAIQNEHWDLNQSDRRVKVVVEHPRVYPSVHYGYYGWGKHHRHYSGVRVGRYY